MLGGWKGCKVVSEASWIYTPSSQAQVYFAYTCDVFACVWMSSSWCFGFAHVCNRLVWASIASISLSQKKDSHIAREILFLYSWGVPEGLSWLAATTWWELHCFTRGPLAEWPQQAEAVRSPRAWCWFPCGHSPGASRQLFGKPGDSSQVADTRHGDGDMW